MASGKQYKRFAGHSVNNAGYHNENWDRFFDGNSLYDVGFDSLADAVAYIGRTNSKTLYITTKHRITRNTTIPSNISVVPVKGGSFSIANGVTLTMPLPKAGRFQWITWTGTGRVRFTRGPGKNCKPEWWGAVATVTAGTTDSYAAIQAAAEAARAGEIELNFGEGTYQLSAGISITGDGVPIRWVGRGKYNTYLRAVAGSSFTAILSLTDTDVTGDANTYSNYASRSFIDGVSFDGGGAHNTSTGAVSTAARAQYGIKGITNHLTLKNSRVKGTGTCGFDLGNGWDNNYIDCEASQNQGDGYRQNRIASNNGLSYHHCDAFDNLGWGYRFREGVGIEISGAPAVEQNRKGGIFLEGNVKAYKIGVIYTESNAADGHGFTHEGSTDTGAGGVVIPQYRTGTAQAGGASTITLDSGASAVNDFYKNYGVEITAGTGVGQKRKITGYVGATKVATVSTAWTTAPDNTSEFAVKLFIGADILINGSTETEAISNAFPCTGTVLGCQVSAGGAGYFIWAPGQAGLSVFGCALNDGECALIGSYGNSSSSSFENSWSSLQNIHTFGNRGWGTDPSPTFSFDLPGPSPKFPGVSTLGNSVLKANVTNTFLKGVSQVNAAPVDMNSWAVTNAGSGGTFLKSSEVFTQDPTADVYELALSTTGTSDAYGVSDINASDYEHLQGKFVVASVWMKHTDIADVTGVLRISSSADFSSKQISMDYYTGTAVGWQRITGVFKFPSGGTVTFDVRKIEQSTGNIGSIWVTMPILCEVGSDFQMIQSRTVVREKYKTVLDGQTASSTDAQGQAPITTEAVRYTTVPATNSCTLRPAKKGRSQYIRNDGANTLTIYPDSGDAINGGSVDASVTLAAGASVRYEAVDGTNWYS